MGLSRGRLFGEFEGVGLGDVRRDARLRTIVEQVARQPGESLPRIAGGEAELEALYRFLGNPGVDWSEVLKPHRQQTVKRAEEAERVVVIHDTTTFHFSHADPHEVGWISTGKAGFLG